MEEGEVKRERRGMKRREREVEEVGIAMVRQRGEGGMRTTATHVTGRVLQEVEIDVDRSWYL